HSLRLTVTAEGVETAAQAEGLGQVECDSAQGYLFAPPLPPGEITRWLRAAPADAPPADAPLGGARPGGARPGVDPPAGGRPAESSAVSVLPVPRACGAPTSGYVG
ncbi:EAL domain-containing protein, partial [Frankia sp. AvcI1]